MAEFSSRSVSEGLRGADDAEARGLRPESRLESNLVQLGFDGSHGGSLWQRIGRR